MIDEKNTNDVSENEKLREHDTQNTDPINDQTEPHQADASTAENDKQFDEEQSPAEDDDAQTAPEEAVSVNDSEDKESDTCAEPTDSAENGSESAVTSGKIENVKSEEKYRKSDSIFDFIEIFVFALAAIFIITSFFFRYSIVSQRSMEDTLYDGDKLIISDFMYEPEYKDIVVVYSDVLDKIIVKRVIATEGQTVSFTATGVYVDGQELKEPYVYTDDYVGEYHYENPEEMTLTVPEGEIYVMGDHRNLSDDSRRIGTISTDAIIGKVIFRFAPFDKFGKVE